MPESHELGSPQAPTFYSERQWRIERNLELLYERSGAEVSLEEFRKKAAYTQYASLLGQIADSTLDRAKARGQDPEEFSFELDVGFGVCQSIYDALEPKRDKDSPFLVWTHIRELPQKIRSDDLPSVRRQELYDATGEYLRLPIRCAMADRILVDALIAVETIDYGWEMFGKQDLASTLFPSRSPFKQRHVFWKFLTSLAFNFVFFALLTAATAFLGYKDIMASSWSLGISATWVALFFVSTILQVVSLPAAWRRQTKARALVADLMNEMLLTYDELRDDGPVSPQRVRDVAERAASKGVAWPGALFALLDDMRSRNARL
ncbi:hypothetical protein [Reyranella sp.]|uniref:hypothetical protein n=1 Tax=Reyranella sp. TaxID=1929291 RepID=UPI002630842C|nr:hypothetical protein [Reyranella sp.]HQS15458.1 hypothetical protein [Reyranella sp.]HQT11984.1 hypothetical protein [Reyranella sp.]